MSNNAGMVILGAGLAGDTAVGELREAGWGGEITLIGDEPHRPYDRPPLSKAVLLSADEEERAFLRPAQWYADHDVTLRLGDGCTAIDPDARRVTLASGAQLPFAKLLIATGARARRLPFLETGAVPAYYLRSLADARALREKLAPGARLIVIGAGVIGLEVAASAVQRGCAVEVLEGLDRVMARCVSPRVSDYLHGYHRDRGVRIRFGARLAAVQDRPGALLLDSGEALPADLVVVGVGAEPNVELAVAAGLDVDDGILVDRQARTSHPDIHAAGDVTRFETDGEGYARAEHWRHAIEQAAVAARVMAGADESYREQPWLWSDQYDLNIQVTGAGQGEVEALRGDPAANAFILFQLRGGRVVGAVSVNQARHKRAVASLVSARSIVDPAVLSDPGTDLKRLAAELVDQS